MDWENNTVVLNNNNNNPLPPVVLADEGSDGTGLVVVPLAPIVALDPLLPGTGKPQDQQGLHPRFDKKIDA